MSSKQETTRPTFLPFKNGYLRGAFYLAVCTNVSMSLALMTGIPFPPEISVDHEAGVITKAFQKVEDGFPISRPHIVRAVETIDLAAQTKCVKTSGLTMYAIIPVPDKPTDKCSLLQESDLSEETHLEAVGMINLWRQKGLNLNADGR